VSNVKVRLEAQRSISLLNLKNLLRESFTFNQNQENMALSRVYCVVMGEKFSQRAKSTCGHSMCECSCVECTQS
jgi:hypothetical protein